MSAWIKCSDRLPEMRERVLVWGPEFFGGFVNIASRSPRGKGSWVWMQPFAGLSGHAQHQVTKWMPIPSVEG